MYLSDYHIHSEISGDSEESLEVIFETAIKKGLKEVAITDHLDIDYPKGMSTFDLDFQKYVETLKGYKERYRGRLKIKLGIELGLQPHLKDNKYLNEVLQSKDLDFIIGSIHCIEGKEVEKDDFFFGKTKEESHKKYFEEVYQNIKIFDGFSVCGHLDFIKRYGSKYFDDYKTIDYEQHKEIIDKILKTLIEKEKGIEVNTSSYRYGINEPTPNEYIIKRYYELGGKIITIGSDAHSAKDIAKDLDRGLKLLKNCGFNSYSIFNKKQVEFKEIKEII